MPKKQLNEIEQFNEWQEHQYNSGYWINRFGPFFPPKRSKGPWLLGIIGLSMAILAVLVVASLYLFVEHNPSYLGALGFLMLVGLACLWQIFRFKPISGVGNTTGQKLHSQHSIHHKKEKASKAHKKRKDYH